MGRPLSAAERIFWLLGQDKVLNFAIVARVEGQLPVDRLPGALERLRAKHPLIAVRVAADDRRRPWFHTDGVAAPPVHVLPHRQEDDWVAEVHAQLGCPFDDETGPLVRVVAITGPQATDLIVICHHAVADGLSVAYLVRDLLRLIAEPDTPVPRRPPIPPLETLVPPGGLSTKLLLGTAARLFRVRRWLESIGRPGDHQQAPALPEWSLHRWTLTDDDTQRLVARCKEERTTVQGALCAAFVLAFADADRAAPRESRTVQTAVDLRDRFPCVGDAFGFFVTRVITPVDFRAGLGFMEVARRARDDIARATAADPLFRRMRLVARLMESACDADVLRYIRALRDGTELAITNLGRIDLSDVSPSCRVNELYNVVVPPAEGRVLSVTTVRGRMCFAFAWRPSAADTSTPDDITRLAFKRLADALECSEFASAYTRTGDVPV